MKSEYEACSPVTEAVNGNAEDMADDEEIWLDGEELQIGTEESLMDDEESQMDDGEWTRLEREWQPLFKAYFSRYGDDALPHSLPPFQAILDLAEKRKQEERQRWKRTVTRVACILAVCLVGSGGIAAWMLSNQSSATEAGWVKQLHVAEDGSYTTKDEISDDSVTVKYTSIDDLQKAKRFLPQLCVPAYIPEGYGLQSLSVTKTGDGSYIADYVFQNEEEEFYITQMGGFPAEASVSIYGTMPEEIVLGEPFVSEPFIGETVAVGIIKENEIISISSDEVSENELLKIAESMKINE